VEPINSKGNVAAILYAGCKTYLRPCSSATHLQAPRFD